MLNDKKQKLQEAIREMRRGYHDDIAADIRDSEKTYIEIAEQHGVSEQTVFQIARVRGLCRTMRDGEASHE